MAKIIQVYGAVVIKSQQPHALSQQYQDDDIKLLAGKSVGAYGRHWIYDGDQGFEESTIHIDVKWADGKDHQTFVGRSGLKDALIYIQQHTE